MNDSRRRARRVMLDVTREEIALVRESGEGLVRSFEIGMRPKVVPDHEQPTEWHEGRTLLGLAAKMAAAFRKAKDP